MDIQANQTTDTVLTPAPKRRRFYRYGFFTLLVCCLFLGIFTLLVMTQARSNAQAEQFRAMAALRDSEQRSEWSEVPSRPSDPVRVPTPTTLPASSGLENFANRAVAPFANTLPKPANSGPAPGRMQAVTRMVQQLQTIPFVDPVTGVKTLTQRVVNIPVTTMEPSWTLAPTPDSFMDYQPLEADIQRLSSWFRTADLSQRKGITEALSRKLTELFDARHKAQTSRVEAIKAEVQQTQELLDNRLQLKSQIVDRRLKELTGQRDELSWNPTVANALPSAAPSGVLRNEMGLSTGEPVSPRGFSDTFAYQDSPNSMPSPNLLPTNHPTPAMPILNDPDMAPLTSTATRNNTIDFAPSETIPLNLPNPSLPPIPQPSILYPQPDHPIPTTGEPANNTPAVTGTTSDPQRSFMSIGFKLKGLVKDLAKFKTNNSDLGTSKAATNLENAIDETRSVWEFEKSSLQLDLETTESEYGIVKSQLERATEIWIAEKARNAAGVSSNDLAKTELSRLEIARQFVQLRSRLASFKKSLDWMARFEETVLKQD